MTVVVSGDLEGVHVVRDGLVRVALGTRHPLPGTPTGGAGLVGVGGTLGAAHPAGAEGELGEGGDVHGHLTQRLALSNRVVLGLEEKENRRENGGREG